MATEHERWLAEEHFKKPVIVYNYPKDIKAFYMRLNDDNKTVAAMDVLVPKVGELIGGSQREERLDVLERRMVECDLVPEEYSWYLDLRRYGTVTHAGFGLDAAAWPVSTKPCEGSDVTELQQLIAVVQQFLTVRLYHTQVSGDAGEI